MSTGYAGYVEVDSVLFTQSALALRQADGDAATCFQTLVDGLSTTHAMAGTDTPAQSFADAYDTTATTTGQTVDHLLTGLAALTHAVGRTALNHLNAETASHPGAVLDALLTHPGQLIPDLQTESPTICWAVPSSLGGDPASLPGWAAWVLDHVGGFVWPDADTGKLRAAATAWTTAASTLHDVTGHCDHATSLLAFERSPEIDLALDRIQVAGTAVPALADQMTTLATACTSYADAVDEHRTQILDLVRDLLRDTALMQLGGAFLDAFTAGGGTAAATGLAIAKIADKAPEFTRILDSLAEMTRAAATTLQAAADTLTALAGRLAELLHLNRNSATLSTVLDLSWLTKPGWLERFDDLGSHIVSRHVGRTDKQLMERFEGDPRLTFSSTFNNVDDAESATGNAIRLRHHELQHWLTEDTTNRIILHSPADGTIGRCLDRSGVAHQPNSVRLVVNRDTSAPGGFRVHSTFPEVRSS